MGYGQKNCGTVTYHESLKDSGQETDEAFETWIRQKLQHHRLEGIQRANARTNQVMTIPVVVHIIHNGEPIGSGSNIHQDRVLEQIDRLNKDFRRLNADSTNTPVEFKPVAADTQIEFVLALRDPYGLPTDGINRVTGTRPVYDLVHNTELKALSYWPAEEYLNLWVAELENLLGYAQFPVSTLNGLELASENRLTDGVVIDTDFFGVNPALSPASIGRTATHEIGHYLGLRHTWGDGGCSIDDFCDDTPRSNTSNFGCPDVESCGSKDMVQNYMDLSDDLCMNLFTLCQRDRMQIVMNNSPRRASLASSMGATPPVMVENDAGIREILMPQNLVCVSAVSPRVVIQNAGTNQLTTTSVELLLDGTPVESKTVSNALQPLETTTINFSSLDISDMSTLSVRVIETNGGADGNPENNQREIQLNTATFSSLPVEENFNNFPANWEVRNHDNDITWELATAPSDQSNNTAATLNFFNYVNINGEYDYLISPALDLTTYTGLTLSFDVSYAPFSAGDKDGLIVAISEDCGNTFPTQQYVYFKQGFDLATASPSGAPFVPSGRGDWTTEVINLDQYAGSPALRIAFIGINDYGNNLYLDNISFTGNRVPDIDLAVSAPLQPAAVLCPGLVTPTATVRNSGIQPVSSFQLSYQLESGETDQLDYTGPPLSAGQEVQVGFDPVMITATGNGKITYQLTNVEGHGNDGLSTNNSMESVYLVDDTRDLIPKIEEFQGPLESTEWSQLSQDTEVTWSVAPVSGIENESNQAAFMNFYNYPQVGAIDYLASPVLDFSAATKPTMTFDLAYAGNGNFQDGLLILVSTDCGRQYSDTVFQAFGEELATTFDSNEFFPAEPGDWELQTIDLAAYAGFSDVRIALVAINDFGNNLFVDNIQFFLTDRINSLSFEPDQMVTYPNPNQGEFNITFRLNQRSPMDLRLMDSMGRIVWDLQIPEVLNQTYEVNLVRPAGIYILQASGPGFRSTRRIIVL